MNPDLGYEIALAAVVVYAAIVYALWRAGRIGPDRVFSLMGPALMIKTRRGRSALDRWGRFTRFWTWASDLGVALAALAMIVIVILLLFGAVASLRLSPSTAPNPATALGLPGINPFIPIGYGLIALVVGIVLHELAHGIVARSQSIGVKSLGVLWCVVPVGAFVEQDDTEMLAASRRRRDRVAAAGVLANFALAVVFFALLSGLVATSAQPVGAGVGVVYVQPGSTAAVNTTLAAGDLILAINGVNTTTVSQFQSAIDSTTPGQNVSVVYRTTDGAVVTAHVVLGANPSVATRGFLGVGVEPLSPADLKQTLVFPLGSRYGPLAGSIYWLVLPFATLEPIGGPTISFFHITGPLAAMGAGNFWILANVFYWLAWMNLLLGLSNALPLVPLDGGLLIRDFAASVAARWHRAWDSARLDAFGARAAAYSSIIVLVLLVWQFVVPRLL